MPDIHPTALVDASARLGQGVTVGAYARIESDTVLGDGCRVMDYGVVRRYTQLGPGNVVHPTAVLGGEPQDLKFDPATVTYVRTGADCVFREGVTVSRATRSGQATLVGDNVYMMAQSHVGHDSVVEDSVVMANCVSIGGHCQVGKSCFLGGGSGVHQYCWLGQGVIWRGISAVTQHVPPFMMGANISDVVGLNVVGMRRMGLSNQQRHQVRQAYHILYFEALPVPAALARMDECSDWEPPAVAFREFVRRCHQAQRPYNRGICRPRRGRGMEVEKE